MYKHSGENIAVIVVIYNNKNGSNNDNTVIIKTYRINFHLLFVVLCFVFNEKLWEIVFITKHVSEICLPMRLMVYLFQGMIGRHQLPFQSANK